MNDPTNDPTDVSTEEEREQCFDGNCPDCRKDSET